MPRRHPLHVRDLEHFAVIVQQVFAEFYCGYIDPEEAICRLGDAGMWFAAAERTVDGWVRRPDPAYCALR